MSFQIALSGLAAATTDLDVTANNISNSRTNGFKEARAEFGDVFASSISDSSATSSGRGVRVNRVAQQFRQGTVDFTSRNLDLAINGDGFFVMKETGGGATEYTRAGAFSADRDGFIVNHKGQRLQIYPAVVVSGATQFTTGVLNDLQLPLSNSAPNATTKITTAINLDAAVTAPTVAFDVNNPATYNYSTSTTVYDSLGASHTATFYYEKTAASTWDVHTFVDGVDQTATANTMVFSNSGALTTPTSGTLSTVTFTPSGATGAANMTISLDVSKMTQFGGSFAVSNITQDGYATGRLSGLDIDAEGVVFARYTNGQATALGKVAMAKFNSPQNLAKLGDTNWGETFASGSKLLGEAGTSSFGTIQSGALEASNVDLAEQLVNLIVAQRNFQANAKVITTSDTITQTIINI